MIFGTLPGGAPVELFELSSDKLTVRISNYGGASSPSSRTAWT
ncbi:MAG: hypothetical protein ACLT38_00870 [Akkermansia sp.]